MERILYTIDEVAVALGLGRTKVYELIKTGQLGSVLIDRSRRVPAEAVTAFLACLQDRHVATGSVHMLEVDGGQSLSVDGTMAAASAVEEAS
jgi:excisionase family DNA binding protein